MARWSQLQERSRFSVSQDSLDVVDAESILI